MLYKVRYGEKWLCGGKLGHKERVYPHPSSAIRSAKGFEKRNPSMAGKGTLVTIRFCKEIADVPIF